MAGHSLGAALVRHAAMDGIMNYNVWPGFVCTFGLPRIADDNFTKSYNSLVSINHRMTHSPDPMPHFPSESTGPCNVSMEIFYDYHRK